MAHSLSAKKRIRQNQKRAMRNKARKSALKTEIKKFLLLIRERKVDDAEQQLRTVYKKLDRTADQGTIHKNTAARKKSRLTAKLLKLKQTRAAAHS